MGNRSFAGIIKLLEENPKQNEPYWLESAARAFSSRGIIKYREGVCGHLDEEVGKKCSAI